MLVETVRSFDLRDADAAELERQRAHLESLDLRADDVRSVRDACVAFREALRAAEIDQAAARAVEASGEMADLPALLARVEAAVDRAERFGLACEEGVHGLATR